MTLRQVVMIGMCMAGLAGCDARFGDYHLAAQTKETQAREWELEDRAYRDVKAEQSRQRQVESYHAVAGAYARLTCLHKLAGETEGFSHSWGDDATLVVAYLEGLARALEEQHPEFKGKCDAEQKAASAVIMDLTPQDARPPKVWPLYESTTNNGKQNE
jgi:hypothetical protein